ncbi:MAG: flagellar biosynthetic protein FliR [Rhodoferax sp.]|nr:flagellar biosynthetic protein FliR [Rhodoferax sp.]HPW06072.1 flagellar biosynthetic protein FliR [Burkholderiaceae bacterium]
MISVTEAQLTDWLSPILWPFFRILAVFTAAPIFSSRAFPVRARIGLAFLIALAAQASLNNQQVIGINSPDAFGAVLQQVGVGLAIGFAVRLVFSVFELAGQVVGFQMGLGFAAFFDPSTSAQSSAMGRFYANIAALMFLAVNAHVVVLMAVIRSFEAFPVDQNFLSALQKMQLHTLGAELFASALWIALPVIGMLMFANLALGIVSRVAPQMNIFSVGFPVTLAVGLLGVAATLSMLDQPFMRLMERVLEIF